MIKTIGILAYRQYPYVSANTSIAYLIGDALASFGYEIKYIGLRQTEDHAIAARESGRDISFFNREPIKPFFSTCRAYAQRLCGEDKFMIAEAHKLRRFVKGKKIDALICCIAPMEDAFIVHRARLNIPCILYQMDPYYNMGDLRDSRKEKLFYKVISSFRHIFTTDLLYEGYAQHTYYEIPQVSVAQFPKLCKPKNTGALPQKHTERPTLLYAGSLYADIRSPSILMDLGKAVQPYADLIFCGGGQSQSEEDEMRELGIQCRGFLSEKDLLVEYEKADVLINIGNLVHNQMGSKIVEYLAKGKPIINITQIENDPAEKILERYPLKINLKKAEIISDSELVKQFVLSVWNKTIPFDNVLAQYPEFTPEYVAKQILSILQE